MGRCHVGAGELDVAARPAASQRRRAEDVLDDAAAVAAGNHQSGRAVREVGRIDLRRQVRLDEAFELTDTDDVARSQ